ncbi:MAG: serine protease [Acidimicrobiales bacterium]|nr:serine protease [Acidimicrobiales bacterium]
MVAAGLLAAVAFVPSTPVGSAPTWAPAATAAVHPGVQTLTAGAQCTANFVFTSGTRVFIGQAAHCSGTGGSTETDGCLSGSLPLGTEVTVTGASKPGHLVYNSWLTMQSLGETDPDTCAYNDLALVELDPADYGKVNPSIPSYGGPVGISAGTAVGDTVYSYGNSELRGGVSVLSPKTGISIGDAGNGWTHQVYTVSPGIPGDSGSAFLDKSGKALGVLSTLSIAPTPLSNNVSDLSRMLAYENAHGPFAAQLVLGTEAFKPSLVGLIPFG